MQSNKLITHFTEALLESATSHGVSVTQRQRTVSNSGETFWTGDDFVYYLRAIGSEMDDAYFGLATSRCPIEAPQFGVELMLLSSNLGEALDRFFRFYGMTAEGLAMSLSVTRREGVVTLSAVAPELDPKRFLIEWYTARIVNFAQWLVGNEIPELAVEFSHARQLPQVSYTATFGTHVTFERESNRIVLPQRYLAIRLIRTIDDVVALTSSSYDPEQRTIGHRKWGSLLKAALRNSLFEQKSLPSMEEHASKFGVSSQTLRRGLRTERTSYREIKAEARREVVESSLADTSLSISEISVLAGFADPNGLLRAMKAWTGLSMTAYRLAASEPDKGVGGPADRVE